MKNFKKLMALVIAGAMVLGTMSMAFADPEPELIVPEGLTADTTITITGLDDEDEVTLYKLIEWKNNATNTSAGWVLTDAFKNVPACQAVLEDINAVTDGVYSLTQDDVKAFTDVINRSGGGTAITDGEITDGTYTCDVDPGMYIALVKPAIAGTLYNPIIVSADYFDNGTDEIDTSAQLGENAGIVKKETTIVEKTQDDPQDNTDNSYDVGDTVNFKVETTIPTFAEVYTAPAFTVTDEMSDGLVLTTGTVKVYKEDGTTEIDTLTTEVEETGTTGWVLDVPTDYIQALEAPQKIVIKFDAVLTESAFSSVTEEVNDVKVEFSNNPNDSEDKGTVKDKTRTYTFSIDGSLLGQTGVLTSELVKVAVDGNGDPIYQSSSTNETYTNALKDAVFGLYTDPQATTPYSNVVNGVAKTWDHIVTDSNGYMEINGLDVGTYYLKELTAPRGFIKDQEIHEIVISATYDTESVTEDGYTYTLPKLATYTITIDGASTSTYSMTLDGSEMKTSSIVEASNALLNNTKGVELPSTGGMGTTLFYAIGAILVLGAGILLVSKRRMAAN